MTYFLLTTFIKAPPSCGRGLWRVPFGLKKALICLAAATEFVLAFSSVAMAQQFRDVSTAVGLISEAKKSVGNPIWGDINNDGFLDLIVPCHGLAASGGPLVYINNRGRRITYISATCLI